MKLRALAFVLAWVALLLSLLALARDAYAWDYGRDLQAANAYWHTDATDCQPRFVFWQWDPYGDRDIAGRGDPESCTIQLDTGNTEAVSAYAACLVVVHERGHTLGFDHSADPANIMYPSIDVSLWVPECYAATQPPARKHRRPARRRAIRHTSTFDSRG